MGLIKKRNTLRAESRGDASLYALPVEEATAMRLTGGSTWKTAYSEVTCVFRNRTGCPVIRLLLRECFSLGGSYLILCFA